MSQCPASGSLPFLSKGAILTWAGGGGGRPSLAPGEEWLLRISPPQNSVIGGRMHSEEESEEALLTRLLPWAKMPPARLGDLDLDLTSNFFDALASLKRY